MSKYKQAKRLLRRWKQRHPNALENGDPILARVLETLGEDKTPLTGVPFVDLDASDLCRQIERHFKAEILGKSSFENVRVTDDEPILLVEF